MIPGKHFDTSIAAELLVAEGADANSFRQHSCINQRATNRSGTLVAQVLIVGVFKSIDSRLRGRPAHQLGSNPQDCSSVLACQDCLFVLEGYDATTRPGFVMTNMALRTGQLNNALRTFVAKVPDAFSHSDLLKTPVCPSIDRFLPKSDKRGVVISMHPQLRKSGFDDRFGNYPGAIFSACRHGNKMNSCSSVSRSKAWMASLSDDSVIVKGKHRPSGNGRSGYQFCAVSA